MELEIINLSKIIKGKQILNGISFKLKKGDALALKGKNGTGKTTLIRLIAGIDKNYEGCIINKNLNIGYVPQDIVLFEDFNVIDNIKIFCNTKKDFNILEFYAKKINLFSLFRKKVKELSGGQKRLVNFIIGLAGNPNLLLLDEIIVGLDDEKIENVINLINYIKNDKIIILISHNEDFINKICTLNGILKNGKLEMNYEI